MGLRDSLNNHPVATTVVALLLLVGSAIGFMLMQDQGRRSAVFRDKVFFVDLKTGQQFIARYDRVAPIRSYSDAPDEASGVRAYVFGCGSCNDDAFVAYVERFTAEGRTIQTRLNARGREMPSQTERLALMDTLDTEVEVALWEPNVVGSNIQWHVRSSEPGQRVVNSPRDRCRDQPAMVCSPGAMAR